MKQASDFIPVRIAVLTVSDTRQMADDKSGQTLVDRIEAAGHQVVDRKIVADERAQIAGQLRAWCADDGVDAVISTGGTGLTGQGRALSKSRGAGFIALNWLENDGDGVSQEQAAIRWKEGADRVKTTRVGGIQLTHLIGKKAALSATDCVAGEIVVVSVTQVESGPCQIYGPERLRRTGSIALYHGKNGLRVVTAKDVTGARLWNTRPKRHSRWSDAAVQ